MDSDFMAPIPGQSLTIEPGNVPWEQPPLHTKVEDVLKFYIDKISKEDAMDDLLFLLEEEMPLRPLVESMLTVGVMEGFHTLDTAILVGPAIHEYIMDVAKTAGIEVVEGGMTKEQKENQKEKMRLMVKLGKSKPSAPPMEEMEMDDQMELPLGDDMAEEEELPESEPLISRRM